MCSERLTIRSVPRGFPYGPLSIRAELRWREMAFRSLIAINSREPRREPYFDVDVFSATQVTLVPK